MAMALWCASVAHATEPAEVSPAELQQVFLKASQAYDEGRLGDAISLYEGLADRGYACAELFYNLGNSYFRNGQPGLAVLNYRRAWQLAPRDADIEANLRFALGSTGAVAPSPSPVDRALEHLNLAEWTGLATAAYWAGAFLLCVRRLTARGGAWMPRLLTAALLVLLLSLAGIAHWRAFRSRPEVVVIRAGQEALFAPLEGSTAHFELPEGSIARVIQRSQAWVEVVVERKAGWIPESACRPVSAWQSG